MKYFQRKIEEKAQKVSDDLKIAEAAKKEREHAAIASAVAAVQAAAQRFVPLESDDEVSGSGGEDISGAEGERLSKRQKT